MLLGAGGGHHQQILLKHNLVLASMLSDSAACVVPGYDSSGCMIRFAVCSAAITAGTAAAWSHVTKGFLGLGFKP